MSSGYLEKNLPSQRKRTSRAEAAVDLKKLSWILLAVYILMLIPVLWIGRYDAPSADDFSMGLGTRLVYEETGSVAAVLGKVLSETIRYYQTWIGYFTSCLFTTVSPATFGDGWYWLTPFIVLGGLHIGVIFFLYALMERLLGMDRYARRCMSVLLLFLMVQLMPEGAPRAEAFYWYSGAGNYTLTFSLGLCYLGCLILAVHAGNRRKRFFWGAGASLLGFLAGGGNYLSALSYAIVSAVFLILLLLLRSGCMGRVLPEKGHVLYADDWKWVHAVPAVCNLAGLAVSCLAPGNRIRGEETGGYGSVKSILLSLYYTLSYPMNQWLSWAVIAVLAMAAVVFTAAFRSEMSGKMKEALSYRYPLAAIIFSYGIVSAAVTPALYAQGNMDAGRIQSTFWLHAVLVLLILEWYLIGGLVRVGFTAPVRPGRRALVSAAGLWIVFSLLAVKGNPDLYTGSRAAADLISGAAARYGEENGRRLSVLQDEGQPDAELPRYCERLSLLYYVDVSEDPGDWVNQKLSEYYHKSSVRGVRSGE